MERTERREPPLSGSQSDLLRGFLAFQRDTFEWKARGLNRDALNQTHPPSTLTAAGLLKHLALVESYWLSEVFVGGSMMAPFDTVDWSEDSDWELTTAPTDSPEFLFDLYLRSCAETDLVIDRALTTADLDQRAAITRPGQDEPVSLGWILIHLIEEYARHNGHLDLIRESIDGLTGE